MKWRQVGKALDGKTKYELNENHVVINGTLFWLFHSEVQGKNEWSNGKPEVCIFLCVMTLTFGIHVYSNEWGWRICSYLFLENI